MALTDLLELLASGQGADALRGAIVFTKRPPSDARRVCSRPTVARDHPWRRE
jgi:hypothetical protein